MSRDKASVQKMWSIKICEERDDTGPPEISVSGLRLPFHSNGGAEQAACDEGAGGVALRNGKHQL